MAKPVNKAFTALFTSLFKKQKTFMKQVHVPNNVIHHLQKQTYI